MLPSAPVTIPIAPVPVKSAGDAIRVIQNAHQFCLLASYHPAGGETCDQAVTIPVTHTVWVMGKQPDIDEFLKSGAA